MPTSSFQPIRLLDPDCCYKFIYLMANSADPDQISDLDLHCLQRQGISRFSIRVKAKFCVSKICLSPSCFSTDRFKAAPL